MRLINHATGKQRENIEMYKYVECVLRILSPRLAFKCNLLVRKSYRLMQLLINTKNFN